LEGESTTESVTSFNSHSSVKCCATAITVDAIISSCFSYKQSCSCSK